MRTIKELLEVLLENIDEINGLGLCKLVSTLYYSQMVSLDEFYLVKRYIGEHKPENLHTRFGCVFYWTRGRKSPRIKWLKKHIEKNS